MKNRVCGVFLIATSVAVFTVMAEIKRATICTTYGDDIYDYQLDQMIDSVVPPSAKRLIVLTQCYGGDCLDNFKGTNTAVVSATSPGQKAVYGGYDDDAANACKPGAGKTGQNVHDAGAAGKHSQETPVTGGKLAPGAVSLEPVTADGAVRSRHVIVYAGMPDKKGRDNAQRDKIKANFKGQLNTTVKTVGGEGPKDGWDKHGWKRGLQEAINEAAAAIEAVPDPSKEQFLLFVTDHGDMHEIKHVTTPTPPSNSVIVQANAFVAADFAERAFERPGFSITVDIAPFTHEVGETPDGYIPFFPTNAWRILLTPPPPAAPLLLTNFVERFIEFEDGIIGNAPDEGVRLFFSVDPTLFVDSFFDVMYDVEIFNDTPETYRVMDFSQDTGPVAKGESDPGLFVIDGDFLVGENEMILENQNVVVDGCTLTIDGVHVLDRLTLTNNATVTHTAGAEGMLLTVCNDVSVASGSYIRANGRGAVKHAATTGRSGGSHGGRGQPETPSTSCPTFGDAFWPVTLGTGGSADGAGTTRGGGRIQIAADSILLNGSVTANGQNSPEYTGSGSGGSILIEVGTLSGSGSITANGGVPVNAGAGGGGRIAVYAQNAEAFTPSALEAKASAGAGWGTVFMGVPRTVAVTCTGQGACVPAGPVAIPYTDMRPFVFNPMPVSLATNGVAVPSDMSFEWVNTGLWRGTMEDAAWLERLYTSDVLAAGFEALAAGQV
ncbi:MAG: hypothetical protein PHE10_04260, partial [Kiritimatiellae bacterium]|nr:hypothetical protein [Kiritimatiellia bacterium]